MLPQQSELCQEIFSMTCAQVESCKAMFSDRLNITYRCKKPDTWRAIYIAKQMVLSCSPGWNNNISSTACTVKDMQNVNTDRHEHGRRELPGLGLSNRHTAAAERTKSTNRENYSLQVHLLMKQSLSAAVYDHTRSHDMTLLKVHVL